MKIVAMLDQYDFEDFQNLGFESNFDPSGKKDHFIIFVKDLESFREKITDTSINIISMRQIDKLEELYDFIKNNKDKYFRFYEIDKFEEIPENFFDIKAEPNVVSHEYCIADIFNELNGTKLEIRKQEIEDNPESSTDELILPTHKGNRCWLTNNSKNYF